MSGPNDCNYSISTIIVSYEKPLRKCCPSANLRKIAQNRAKSRKIAQNRAKLRKLISAMAL